jgi:hypothetical protein
MSDDSVRHLVGKLSRRATTLVQTSIQSDLAVGRYELPKSQDSSQDNFGTVSGLQLGSPGKKSHLDVASVRSCRKYYMGEGGDFPRVRAVVNQVQMPVACPNTQGCSRMLTNPLWLVFGCRFKQDNLVPLPSLIQGLLARPSTPL